MISSNNKKQSTPIIVEIDSENNTVAIPELDNLKELQITIQENTKQVNSSVVALQSNNFQSIDLQLIENKVTDFFIQEISKNGLLKEINSVNDKVRNLLESIGFFSSNSSYVTGFFSSDFSSEDKSK